MLRDCRRVDSAYHSDILADPVTVDFNNRTAGARFAYMIVFDGKENRIADITATTRGFAIPYRWHW